MSRISLESLNEELKNLRLSFIGKESYLTEKKIPLIKRKRFACVHCQKVSPLGKFGFVQNWWHESPHSCNEGDTWHPSETNVCHLVCPKCNTKNYIYNHPKRDELVDLIDKQGINKEKIFSIIWEQYGSQEPKQTYPKLDSDD